MTKREYEQFLRTHRGQKDEVESSSWGTWADAANDMARDRLNTGVHLKDKWISGHELWKYLRDACGVLDVAGRLADDIYDAGMKGRR